MPRDSLVTIYKSSIRPDLDYADVMFDKPSNSTLSSRIESVQYNAALAIIGTMRGTSKEKLYEERGFETMKERRLVRRLYCFYKILNNQGPAYLYSLLSRIGIIIHVSIPRLDRFSAEQKLRQLENGTNLILQSVKLLHIQYFAKHF